VDANVNANVNANAIMVPASHVSHTKLTLSQWVFVSLVSLTMAASLAEM
jgi:hypothetical protein